MRKNIMTLILTCLAQLIVIVDLAIVNVALPTIQQELTMSPSALQWIVVGYGLFFGGFLLLGGRLGDVLGRRRVLLMGLALFTIASLAAGLASSTEMLILARMIQGFGAALIAPSALSILANTFKEGKERNSALGIFGATGGIAGSIGVLSGGLLTDGPGWQWIFFVNIPIGALLIGLALKYLPIDKIKKGVQRFNPVGAASITAALMALVYGLSSGTEHGWNSYMTIGSFVIAALLIATFVRIESRTSSPPIRFEIFKNRPSASAMATGFFAFGSLFSFIFTTSLLMQHHLHFTPTQTGIAWLVTSVTSFIVAVLTGSKLVTRFSLKSLLVASLTLMALAVLWLMRIPMQASFWFDLFPALLLMGIGSGMIGPLVQIGALTNVHPKNFGLVSGVVETARELGSVIVISAVSTAFALQVSALEGFHMGYMVIGVAVLFGLGSVGLALRKQRAKGFVIQEVLTEV